MLRTKATFALEGPRSGEAPAENFDTPLTSSITRLNGRLLCVILALAFLKNGGKKIFAPNFTLISCLHKEEVPDDEHA